MLPNAAFGRDFPARVLVPGLRSRVIRGSPDDWNARSLGDEERCSRVGHLDCRAFLAAVRAGRDIGERCIEESSGAVARHDFRDVRWACHWNGQA